jgi:hypothetical protein
VERDREARRSRSSNGQGDVGIATEALYALVHRLVAALGGELEVAAVIGGKRFPLNGV